MTGLEPVPAEIRRLGLSAVRVLWSDGHLAEYGNRYLRECCPCAECREKPRRELPVLGQGDEVYAVQIGLVGRYAISIQWSDGHDTGIYSYKTLRQICPCDICVAAIGAAP